VFTTLSGMKEEEVEQLESIQFKTFWVHLPSSNNEENIQVNDSYLAVLNRLIKSKMTVSYHIHGSNINSKIRLPPEIIIHKEGICDQAGSMGSTEGDRQILRFKNQGTLSCIRELRQNILLANGEVVLCCMDYGLKHILGNLLTSDFKSLYLSEEYKRIEKGLIDDTSDIICRYCNCALEKSFLQTCKAFLKWRHSAAPPPPDH
jgi:hypothetical protein